MQKVDVPLWRILEPKVKCDVHKNRAWAIFMIFCNLKLTSLIMNLFMSSWFSGSLSIRLNPLWKRISRFPLEYFVICAQMES